LFTSGNNGLESKEQVNLSNAVVNTIPFGVSTKTVQVANPTNKPDVMIIKPTKKTTRYAGIAISRN
jgi:hypothetical protein